MLLISPHPQDFLNQLLEEKTPDAQLAYKVWFRSLKAVLFQLSIAVLLRSAGLGSQCIGYEIYCWGCMSDDSQA